MKFTRFLPASLLAVSLISMSSLPAQAAPPGRGGNPAGGEQPDTPPPGRGGQPDALPVSCEAGAVTAVGLGPSTSCIGSFTGNDAQENGSGDLFDKLSKGEFNGLTAWEFVGKSDKGAFATPFDDGSGTSGTWKIASALTGPFVLSLKASNSWSAYFFENAAALEVFEGSWNTLGVSTNDQGTPQALSHATIYRAVVDTPPEPPQPVPEPGTAVALGFLAVGALGRLKQKQIN